MLQAALLLQDDGYCSNIVAQPCGMSDMHRYQRMKAGVLHARCMTHVVGERGMFGVSVLQLQPPSVLYLGGIKMLAATHCMQCILVVYFIAAIYQPVSTWQAVWRQAQLHDLQAAP
jgi:hypothetical protein